MLVSVAESGLLLNPVQIQDLVIHSVGIKVNTKKHQLEVKRLFPLQTLDK
jgi:hypothetical protein